VVKSIIFELKAQVLSKVISNKTNAAYLYKPDHADITQAYNRSPASNPAVFSTQFLKYVHIGCILIN